MARALLTNKSRLVRTRIAAMVTPTSANRAAAPEGRLDVLPGQGGVVIGIHVGDLAGIWIGDHVEPGLSLGHADPAINRAVQILSCVGNGVEIVDGAARGARGYVFGKHGAVLAEVAVADLERVAPGDRVVIDAWGVGLVLDQVPDIRCLSLGPQLAETWLAGPHPNGRLRVPVTAVLPAEAAAAGIGMPSSRFNMDLHSDQPPMDEACRDGRFGDVIAVLDQDHRYARSYRKGWLAIGVVSHGRTIAGGHGLGLMTLLTGPADRFDLTTTPDANIAHYMKDASA